MTAASRVTEGRRFRTMPGSIPAPAPQWRPYVYRGTGEDTLTAWMDSRAAPRKGTGRELKPCGTAAAYKRHHRRGETPCDACKQAAALAYQYRKGAAA